MKSAAALAKAPRVLVVGAGPVGMAAGFLLERVYGVSTRVVERQARPTTHPQAHFINLRSMEVLYATMPEFHDRLLAHAAPSHLWRDYIYCTGGGKEREFARVDQFGPCIPRTDGTKPDGLRDALTPISPTHFLHFPQNQFEEMLDEYVAENGVKVDRGVELVDLKTREGDGPTSVSLRHLASNDVEHAEYDYVIAADGAHSMVRQLCGIDMAGALNLQTIANVHFTSHSLSEAARENPAMLYFVFNQDVIGVLIAHDLNKGEWVFQIPFFPPQESLEWDFSVDQCKAIVEKILPSSKTASVGDDINILSVGQWRMGARVAKQYGVNNRIFLVGDAAHQFPPAGGFGMNTGLQDAHNLVWKLALKIQSEQQDTPSDDTLLDSYERERQHVAKINTQFALRNVERTMKVPTALNVSHNNAKLLARLVNSAPLKYMPLQLQREFVQRIMKVGKLPLGMLDEAETSALGAHMRRKVQDIVSHRQSLGMLFYHFDIGFSYDTTKWEKQAKQLMQDPSLDQSVLFRSDVGSSGSESDVVFEPTFSEGVRFPHIWLEDPTNNSRLSSLDLVGRATLHPNNADKAVQYVLVADANEDLGGLSERLPSPLGTKNVTLALLSSGPPVPLRDASSAFDRIVSYHIVDDARSLSAWRTFVERNRAALIRPDGHVASLWSH